MAKRDEASVRLYHALEAARKAVTYLGDRSLEEFTRDDQLQSSIYWQLMVIGEAMNHASREEPGIHDELPAVPAIIGLRNRIVHGYEEINDSLVLEVLNGRLPELIRELERILATRPIPNDPDTEEQ